MGRSKKDYPQGLFRFLDTSNGKGSVALEYSWGGKVHRKVLVSKVLSKDWNPKGNKGNGAFLASYGDDYSRMNNYIGERKNRVDTALLEHYKRYHDISVSELKKYLNNDKQIVRRDEGQDFVEYVLSCANMDYQRKKIGLSRYKNAESAMKLFTEFLMVKEKGTYEKGHIYLSEISLEILSEYIAWRRDIKMNGDDTINHALTPIIKACKFASDSGLIDSKLGASISNSRIIVKKDLDDDNEKADEFLTFEQIEAIIAYYKGCEEKRRKEYIEMFLFAFYACGLRLVDVVTLQWSNVDFAKKEIRKIMVKTRERLTIPLTDSAMKILEKWKERSRNQRFVFDWLADDSDLNDDKVIIKARGNASKCVNQSLNSVGCNCIGMPIHFHMARHSFAVLALNEGVSVSVVGRLLGHASTSVTEKVYAKFLSETLSSELHKLKKYELGCGVL